MKRVYPVILAAAALLLIGCGGKSAVPATPTPTPTPPPTPFTESSTERIIWHDWEPDTFALAKAESKPILLDLTAVWCHWCHVMDETTYSDPEVIELINSQFIAIRVDTDQRPDIQSRYLMGGWPTTAFLTPEGDVIAGGTYVPPENMVPLLKEVSLHYFTNADTIHEEGIQARQTIQAELNSREPAPGIPDDSMQLTLNWLETEYDPVNGGFGETPKYRVPGAVALIFRHTSVTDSDEWEKIALHSLAGLQNLVDPVWGGVYRYSVSADWQTPHYEKMLADNAEALGDYLEAYQATGDKDYRATAEGIMNYVETFLWDPSGGFYGSQDADLFAADTHQILITGEEYFQLSDKDRREWGVPHVDQTFYTEANGQMIAAALKAAAVLDEPRYQEMALLALDRIWEEGRGPDGQLWHSLSVDESGKLVSSPPATLGDQAYFGLALLAAYSATGQRDYLDRAEVLAAYIMDAYYNPDNQGFYDLPENPDAVGALGVRATLCEGNNIAVANLFTLLYRMTADSSYRDIAEGALRLCVLPDGSSPNYALAVEDFAAYPLTVVVVGTPGDQTTVELLATANQFYLPGKVVIPLDLSVGPPALGDFTYPPDKIAIYACMDQRCSLPVTEPDELAEQVDWLLNG